MSLPALTRAETWEEASALVLRTLAATHHQLDVYSPDLMPALLNTDAAIAQLRRIARSGRHAHLRCLLHDETAVAASDHRLVDLCQRLSSSVELRVVTERTDRSYRGAFIVNDQNDHCHFMQAAQLPAIGTTDSPGDCKTWRDHFESVWPRSLPARSLRQLHL